MDFIEISHLYKTYKTSGRNNDVLKDVSLKLPFTGLVVILGKSGCGKSTLLNIIGGIDSPSKGSIASFSSNSPRPIKTKRMIQVAFVFQNYHLLENETLYFNVILPGLIKGMDKTLLEEQAKDLLKRFGFEESMFEKKADSLSGGEKSRIALLRALITNPRIILADEPTGALDEQNSIKTMDILKKASKKRLVVLVTHNKKLAEMYADRIITLKNSSIQSDILINKPVDKMIDKSPQKRKHNSWIDHFVDSNFKKRFRQNLVSIIGMTIALSFSYFLIGFVSNSQNAIKEVSKKHFDYGSGIISKEIRDSNSDSKISLIKTVRPEIEEIEYIQENNPSFIFENNYDCYLNSSVIYAGNKQLQSISFSYVYDFVSPYIDESLIVSKEENITSGWNCIYINKEAKKILDDENCSSLVIKNFYENVIKTNGEKDVVDYFEVEENLKIVGVVDEFSFLSTPKIYFSYVALEDFINGYKLENASEFYSDEITWKTLVDNAEISSELSSYSYRCFLSDCSKNDDLQKLNLFLSNETKLESEALEISEALYQLTYAATIGLEIFLFICLLGSVSILGIFSFTAYNDDKKISSILSCLGANNLDIVTIFASESNICALFSFALSTLVALFLEKPLNILLNKLTLIPDLIDIPMGIFLGKRFLLPVLFFLGVVITATLFSVVPILISKSLSIKKELSDL